ncbi:hypothetical protein TNIN_357231 [Trichonephila inaurata madagascariensis]|uniref:Uncharacterized protein n=1 Tax=Trichonephila inaurata madagascariensis TaxID=2747483 RepID=A0A8X7BUF6_9ARAC|nr:hypothetical protein TNIN_357231 [Trichonephila inaurata madagascariensis]
MFLRVPKSRRIGRCVNECPKAMLFEERRATFFFTSRDVGSDPPEKETPTRSFAKMEFKINPEKNQYKKPERNGSRGAVTQRCIYYIHQIWLCGPLARLIFIEEIKVTEEQITQNKNFLTFIGISTIYFLITRGICSDRVTSGKGISPLCSPKRQEGALISILGPLSPNSLKRSTTQTVVYSSIVVTCDFIRSQRRCQFRSQYDLLSSQQSLLPFSLGEVVSDVRAKNHSEQLFFPLKLSTQPLIYAAN